MIKTPIRTLAWLAMIHILAGVAYSQNLKDILPSLPFGGNDEEEVMEETVYIEEYDDKLVLTDAPLNTVFQFLAEESGKQYFHNANYSAPEFNVTGNLNLGDPIQQMKDLAFMHGINIVLKGNTVYAFTDNQMNQVPSEELYYQLRYLRPNDIEQVKLLLRPFLSNSAGGGSVVNYEAKTNTLIIIDRPENLKKINEFLAKIDKPKKQIAVEVKILRVNANSGKFRGVDWGSSLGQAGVPLSVTQSLSDLFNLNGFTGSSSSTVGSLASNFTETGIGASGGLVLSPMQLGGVLRALNDQNLSKEISNPTVITEDNESASISIIDRVPIITATTNATTAGTTITEEVRYKIDESDPTVTDDPEKTREIGITISVTPVILPDGTIRMKLRPRSAQITEFVSGAGDDPNLYPRVSEASVDALARVPNGYSLILGGFYGSSLSQAGNDVPLLGKIPGLNFFFKNEQNTEEKTSLVFIVTPKNYDPAVIAEHTYNYHQTHNQLTFDSAEPSLLPEPLPDRTVSTSSSKGNRYEYDQVKPTEEARTGGIFKGFKPSTRKRKFGHPHRR